MGSKPPLSLPLPPFHALGHSWSSSDFQAFALVAVQLLWDD